MPQAKKKKAKGKLQSSINFKNPYLLAVIILLVAVGVFYVFRSFAATGAPAASDNKNPGPKTLDVSADKPCIGAAPPAAWNHVIVLVFENKAYNEVIGSSSAPFINAMATKCGIATNWQDANYDVNGTKVGSYNSKPSYAVMTNGQKASVTGITDDDYKDQTSVDNIFRQIRVAGKTVKSYVEGITSNPTPCDVNASTATSGSYHDAFRYYNGTGDIAFCNANDVDLSKFTTDLNNGTLPNFSLILPKNTSNMHDNSVSSGDTWASNFLTPILNSATYKTGDTAIFFIWDEDTPIPNALIAPSMAAGTVITSRVSHYSGLRTWDEMLGLPLLADSAKATSLLTYFRGGR